MKKILLSAFAVFAFTNINAQEINFGVKAGVNFASISGDGTDDFSGRTNFHIGGVAEIAISDKFSVQPELLYSAKGASVEESFSANGISSSVDGTTRLNYLSLPVLAKYYITEGLSIEGGPQLGLLLSAETETTTTVSGLGTSETISSTDDIGDEVNGLDFGLGLGIGYKLDNGLNFAARYTLGISNINDAGGDNNISIQNNVFQVSVGFMF